MEEREKDQEKREKERKLASLPYLIRSNFIKTNVALEVRVREDIMVSISSSWPLISGK